MGFVDRGGGREAKGASLRRSKKNPGAAAARVKTETKGKTELTTKQRATISPQVLASPTAAAAAPFLVDSSVAFLSRKFDADRDRILQRAADESNVGVCITWCGEVERQEALLSTSNEKPGRMFCVIGVHPDNVDRTNKKAHQGWAETAEQLALQSSCVALLGGLDFTREQSTHFPQEALLITLMEMAAKHQIPLVAHVNADAASAERFAEIYLEREANGAPLPQIVFHDSIALAIVSPSILTLLSGDARVFGMVSSRGLFDGDDVLSVYRTTLSKIPMTKWVLSSDSPWHTPQNIEDEYLRTLHNEPANLRHSVRRLAEVVEVPEADLIATVLSTSLKLFFAESEGDDDSSSEGHSSNDDEATPIANSKKQSAGKVDVPPRPPTTAPTAVAVTTDGDADDDEGESGEMIIAASTGGSVQYQYSCVKCRALLFTSASLVTHGANAPRATFKSGKAGGRSEGGSCDTSLFLRATQDPLVALLFGPGDNVSCKGCSCKMGSIGTDVACPCGTVMCGATCRVVASRVDRLNPTATNEDLLSRAANERDNIPCDDDEGDSDDDDKRKQKKPKQNVKANNRSNMSHFRNKNWAPGLQNQVEGIMAQVTDFASRGDDEKKGSKRKKKKGCRGPGSDDDD